MQTFTSINLFRPVPIQVNGPGLARQMRNDLINGLGREIRGDFSKGPGRTDKREPFFLTIQAGKIIIIKKKVTGWAELLKKRKTNNIASQSMPTKGRRSFQTAVPDKILIMYLI